MRCKKSFYVQHELSQSEHTRIGRNNLHYMCIHHMGADA